MSQTFETQFGGRTLTIETGKLARLAGGSVTVRYGDTMVLGTANRSEPRPGLDFFPLTVDFEERMYAAGKIPGGFIKREARPSEAAILAARLTDRPIRPLFPEGYKDDVQLVITVLSTDQENDPDVLGTIAASAALTISEIPFHGPIGAVRVGRIDGEFVVNPTHSQLAESELDLIVSGTRDAIMMVEAGAKLLPEDVMAEAILFGHRALQPLIDLQEELQKAVGKAKRIPYLEPPHRARCSTSPRPPTPSASSSSSTSRRPARTRRWPTSSRSPRSRSRAGKIVDRWSTLVNPGRPIVGNQMHGITDADVKGAPTPAEAARKALDFVGDAMIVGHNVGFDLGVHRGGARRRHPLRAGPLPRHAGHRPRGLPGPRELQAADLSNFFGIELTQSHRALPDAEATANLLLWFAQRPARSHLRRCARRSPTRSAPTGPAATPTRSSRPPAARRASARACSTSSRRRPSASSSSTRASGSTAAA